MQIIKQSGNWQLVSFNRYSGYKIINKNKCYYQTEKKWLAMGYFNEITKGE